MANRLTKITTRGGDKGETSLGDGARVSKTDPRIGLIGEVDELNSWIGVVRSFGPSSEVDEILEAVQHDLFDLGGALSFPGAPLLSELHVSRLDEASVKLNEGLPPLKEFILPGGAPLNSWMHVARTTARRVERSALAFFKASDSGALVVQYLNRLSDVLFVAGRYEARAQGIDEVYWRKEVSANQS